MNTPKRKPTQERKSEIIAAAFKLSAEMGPEGLTTEALAAKVGVSHGAIFRHFATKDAIWSAVFESISTKMEDAWRKVAPTPSPAGRLRLLVRAQLKLVTIIPALPAIIFSRELHKKNANIQKGVLTLMKKFHGVLSKEIQAAIDCGELQPDINATDTANLIIATMQGTVLRWSISQKKFDLVAEGEKMFSLILGCFHE
ncbi:MAG: TetR/AcrR family transcriptional regulator [Rhodospirillaceae bacterium]|nr:TetR/AcrR family transcriptional regulator [Rhodospirillaceae bacterium]